MDVNRTQIAFTKSGLNVTIQLNSFGASANRHETIYYNYVREKHTGLSLAVYQPLSLEEKEFYAPNGAYVPTGVTWDRPRAFFLELEQDSEHVDRYIECQSAVDNDLPMDVWNPHYNSIWSYLTVAPSTSIPKPPPPPLPPRNTNLVNAQTQIHWMN
ncbi:hypothetical protein PQX77_019546 [Marasmius sp. AFHP31]|nr:hypothetical protein PQX77_019546 [Marasmius sp. AFHP31]